MTMSGKWKDGYDAWKGPTSAEKGRAEDPRHPFPKNNYNLSNKSIAQARKDGQSEREREGGKNLSHTTWRRFQRDQNHTHTHKRSTHKRSTIKIAYLIAFFVGLPEGGKED
jgi:hypothetical protein